VVKANKSKSAPCLYYKYKSKSSAEKDAEMLRSKGCEIINIYQSPANAIVTTKEETT
jgi:hypothetical protein